MVALSIQDLTVVLLARDLTAALSVQDLTAALSARGLASWDLTPSLDLVSALWDLEFL